MRLIAVCFAMHKIGEAISLGGHGPTDIPALVKVCNSDQTAVFLAAPIQSGTRDYRPQLRHRIDYNMMAV